MNFVKSLFSSRNSNSSASRRVPIKTLRTNILALGFTVLVSALSSCGSKSSDETADAGGVVNETCTSKEVKFDCDKAGVTYKYLSSSGYCQFSQSNYELGSEDGVCNDNYASPLIDYSGLSVIFNDIKPDLTRITFTLVGKRGCSGYGCGDYSPQIEINERNSQIFGLPYQEICGSTNVTFSTTEYPELNDLIAAANQTVLVKILGADYHSYPFWLSKMNVTFCHSKN